MKKDMEKIISSKTLYRGRLLDLRLDEILLSNGRKVKREIVIHPGASAILPIIEPGKILMVKQYRHPVGEALLEIPAGTLKPGEDPTVCAARELEEETGYRAEKLVHLVTIYPTPGYSSEILHIYLAKDLRKGVQAPEVDEDISVVEMTSDQVLEGIKNGKIKDSKTITAILYYLVFIEKNVKSYSHR